MLSFDTLVIDCRPYTEERLFEIYEIFVPLGIKRFLFVFDLDLESDNRLLRKEAEQAHKRKLAALCRRGVHSDIVYRLSLRDAVCANPEIKKFLCGKRSRSLFIEMPILSNTFDNSFATSLNTLLYRRDLTPVFTHADAVCRTYPKDFCKKLLKIRSAAFAFELSSLFSFNNAELIALLRDSRTNIIPSLTRDISEYVAVERLFEEFCQRSGKELSFSISSQINRTAKLITE